MRRLAIICAVLLPAASSAGWKTVDAPGVPYDVQVADAGFTPEPDGGTLISGIFAVATSKGAYEVEFDGGEVEFGQVIDGGSKGAYIDPTGCLWSFRVGGAGTDLVGVGCGAQATFPGLFSTEDVLRFRAIGPDFGYLLNQQHVAPNDIRLHYGSLEQIAADGGSISAFSAVPSGALDATSSSQGGIAFLGYGRGTPGYGTSVDGGSLTAIVSSPSPTDVELSRPTTGLLVRGGGLFRVAPLQSTTPIAIGPADAGISAVAFSPDTEDGGIGFGMAAGAPLGNSNVPRIYRTTAESGPNGQPWVASDAGPTRASGTVVQLDCFGAELCVAVTDADAGNVLIYSNAHAPVSGLPSRYVWDGGSPLKLPFTPYDADGDPVTVLGWSSDGGLAVSFPDAGSPYVTASAPSGACPPAASANVGVRLTDGWSVHDRVSSTEIDFPGTPVAVSPPAGSLTAICGEGAKIDLGTLRPSGACATETVTLDAGVVPDASVEISGGQAAGFSVRVRPLAAADGGWPDMGAILGRKISLQASASGAGQFVSKSATLTVNRADPFLEIDRDVEAPSVPASGILGVRATVRVRSGLACQIRGASLDEDLHGFTYVAGSARVDGVPAQAIARAGHLEVDGLVVSPDHPATVTYDVHAQVWGRPDLDGVAVFVPPNSDAGIPLSERTPLVRPARAAGCACRGASGEGGWALLCVIAMVFAWSKRRRAATDDPPVR